MANSWLLFGRHRSVPVVSDKKNCKGVGGRQKNNSELCNLDTVDTNLSQQLLQYKLYQPFSGFVLNYFKKEMAAMLARMQLKVLSSEMDPAEIRLIR